MGQIAPRRRRTRLPFYNPLLKMWMVNRKTTRKEEAVSEEGEVMHNTPLSARGKAGLRKLWHLADQVRWLDPLPPMHRRGMIIAAIIVLLAILWPAPTSKYPVEQPATSPHHASDAPMQAKIYDNNQPGKRPQSPLDDAQGQWHSFQIAAGQTLAQLFRDNNLPVNDVFAMAQVEGDDKPLSHLRTGQRVTIRQDTQGQVTGLTIDTDNGPVLFTRQADGTFIRAQ